MTRRLAPVPVRLARILRLAGHVVRGLWIVHTRYRRLSPGAQDRELERWARQLLAILGVAVRTHNAPGAFPARCLLVSNHTSWLDIFAVYAVAPGLFVAKSDIRDWPIVGRLVDRVGTLFIERGNRRHARLTNERIVAALERGRLVSVCPEGTTTDGRSLKHFHAALLQPAIDARAMVLPVALRYLDRDDAQTDAAAYVGDDSLVASIWRITSERSLTVELRFVPCFDATLLHRRDVSRLAHAAIAAELGLASASRPAEAPAPAPARPSIRAVSNR